MWAIAILVPLLIGLWVAMDARKKGCSQWKAFSWFLGVWLLLIVFLPLYFILRPKLSQKKDSDKETHVCPYCGKLYTGKVSFCPYCGQKLDDIP